MDTFSFALSHRYVILRDMFRIKCKNFDNSLYHWVMSACLLMEQIGLYHHMKNINVFVIQEAHYCDVIMGAMASEIASLTIVHSTVHSGADQRKHQSSAASLAFVWGIHRRQLNYPHKWPVRRKMFPFDDVIMSHGPCKPLMCHSPVRHVIHVSYSRNMSVTDDENLIMISWCCDSTRPFSNGFDQHIF